MRLAAAAGKAHDSTSFRNAPANRSMFDIAHEGDVAILRMAHGKANALNIELCSALSKYLAEFRTSQARALVITGTGGIFSAGVDLLRLSEGGASYVRKFLPALNAMFAATFSFPKPIVAAINGHAIAGGCVLACAADKRLMARDQGRIGVTELLVGVPFPRIAMEIMHHAVVPHRLEDTIFSGATFAPDDAVVRGLAIAPGVVDRVGRGSANARRALAAGVCVDQASDSGVGNRARGAGRSHRRRDRQVVVRR